MLQKDQIITKTDKTYWDIGTIYYVLKNLAYKGQTAFGRKNRARLPSIRSRKDSSEQPRNNSSRYAVEKEN